MKLEALNNSKYSLTPEKMGKLVGGAAHVRTSGADINKGTSADISVSYSGDDDRGAGGIVSQSWTGSGNNDTSTVDRLYKEWTNGIRVVIRN